MSIINKLKNKIINDNSQENIGKIASETAVSLIKQMSGTDVQRTKRVIDNVVVMTGASGGTGASTLVSNVAHIATRKGFKVLVIDLNIMYPVQNSMFELKQVLERDDLVSYLLGKSTLGNSIDTTKDVSILYANNRGLMESINCEQDIAVSNLETAISKARQLFDLVLIDCPLRIDHTLVNVAFYLSDQIYCVWDEGISSISNTERIRRNMAFSGVDSYTKMRAILNKRTNIQYTKYPFDKLNLELTEVLPFDTAIIESSLRCEVFCAKGATSSDNANEFYRKIESLTDKILQNGGYIG